MNLLSQIDQELFLFLNSLHTPFLDVFMGIITDKKPWIPFYALIILFFFWKYSKDALGIIIALVIIITLSDQFASGFCKPFFARLRPCHNEEISSFIHLVGNCGGDFGFVSSHAANTFALATFLFLLIRKEFPLVKWLFVWATVVSYSRVYVGVHYPADVLFGGLSGAMWAYLGFIGYQFWLKKRKNTVKETKESSKTVPKIEVDSN